ncbi:thiamine diphosphokinase [Candidatus Gottesmanbacteria bacterium]|nr:thiamine diphosphokinase [Candidatus Gottesmanbacteria bacterium]
MIAKIAIVGGGNLFEQLLPEIKKSDFFIGVDRGAAWLLTRGIRPDIAIGDFDSVTKKELSRIRRLVKIVMIHPAEKDFIDMELAAIEAIKRKPKEVVIYGGIGTRLDHTLGTVQLLEHFLNAGISARLVDDHNDICLVSGKRVLEKGVFRYVSVLPFTQDVTVSLQNFLYNVRKIMIHRGMTLGISNEFTGRTGIIDVHKGIALAIQSKD